MGGFNSAFVSRPVGSTSYHSYGIPFFILFFHVVALFVCGDDMNTSDMNVKDHVLLIDNLAL